MPEMHFRMPRFTYSAYGSFTKNKKEHKNQEKGDTRYSYLNEVKKGCFQYDMAYGAYKHLPRRKTSDKVLHDKMFAVAINPKYDRYQRELASKV